MSPFKNKTIISILDYYKNLWAISYVSGVAHWDLETYMPKKGAGSRGEALGRLSVIRQKMFLDPNFIKLIKSAEGQKLNDQEKAVIRILKRALDFYQKVPSDFIEKFEILTNKATVVWREAKEKDDFKIFAPYLQQIFDMNRQMAEYLGYKDSPYDALLDQYEEGLTARQVEDFFGQIKEPLKELLSKIKKSKKYKSIHRLEKTKYDVKKLEDLNNKILNKFWGDFDRFRLDVSSHPFTTSFGINDTRITTWYHGVDFNRSVLATIHEFGHALYDLQSDPGLEMTPIAGGSSLVIHESQSRFWENFVGRNESFIKTFLNDFRNVVNDKSLTTKDIYSYFNKVSPGLLRVEADEVTYHFHIMLRFEIEKGIIEGKLKVKDLPEIWGDKMNEYLGMSPSKDSDGVLQDIHWSGGSVGYFPTYSLGTFLGAQWPASNALPANSVKRSFSSWRSNAGWEEGIEDAKKWLENHIHKFGSTYTLEELLKKNKMKFDPSVNLNYLEKKYAKIYGF